MNNQRIYEAAEWLDYAACGEYGAASMFPSEGDEMGIRLAKANCAVCPVLTECLTGALERGEQWGVWGGMTTEERKSLRRKQQRAGRATTELSLPPLA